MAAFRAPNTPNTDPETPDEDSGLSEPTKVDQNPQKPPSIPSPLGPQQFLLAGASAGTGYGMMKESKKDHIERKINAESREERELASAEKKENAGERKKGVGLIGAPISANKKENRYMIKVYVAASAALCASLVAPTEPTTTQDLGARKPSEAGTVSTDATRAPSDTASDKSCEVVSATELLRVSLPVVGEVECLGSQSRKWQEDLPLRWLRVLVCDSELDTDMPAAALAQSKDVERLTLEDCGLISIYYIFSSSLYARGIDVWCMSRALSILYVLCNTDAPTDECDPTDLLLQARQTLGIEEFRVRCAALDYNADEVCKMLDERKERYNIQLPTPLTQDQLPALLRPDTKK